MIGALFVAQLSFTSSAQQQGEQAGERTRQIPRLTFGAWPLQIRDEQNKDIGTLAPVQAVEQPRAITGWTSQQFFHTDNVFFDETNPQSSVGWSGVFDVTYVPYSTYRWTPFVEAQQSLFRHDRHSAGDFDGQFAAVGQTLALNESRTWQWSSSYSLWRFYRPRGDEGEFYKHGWWQNRLAWSHPLNRCENLYFIGSGGIGWRNASPGFLNRIEGDLVLSLSYRPARKLYVQTYLQPAIYAYPKDSSTQVGRRDFNLGVGALVTWLPRANVSVSTGIAWVGNYSSTPQHDYEYTYPTLGLTGTISF